MFRPIPGGLLIAVEGIDGAGKTSISSLIAQWCGERGLGCVLSKEPTGLKWGTEMRNSAKEQRLSVERELELFLLDRNDHVERAIRPGLAEGNIVILDRYYWSTAAYQGPRGCDVEKIMADNEVFAPVPDLVMILDLEVETGLQRIRNRGDKPNSFETTEALNSSREIFLQLAGSRKNAVVLDSSVPLREIVAAAITAFQAAAINKISSVRPLHPERVDDVLKFFGARI